MASFGWRGFDDSHPLAHTGLRIDRYSACTAALSDLRITSDPHAAGVVPQPPSNLLQMDGEPHATLRQLLSPHLSAAAAGRLAPGLRELAASCVGEIVRAKDQRDLMTDLIERIVLHCAFEIVGIPPDARATFAQHLRAMRGILEPDLAGAARQSASIGSLELLRAFDQHVQRNRSPAGVLRDAVDALADQSIPEEQVLSTLVVLLHGGYENPINFLGSVLVYGLKQAADGGLRPDATSTAVIEELLRWSSPVRGVARWAAAPVEIDTWRLERGESVWIDLEAANRDPANHKTPDEPTFTDPGPHLAFGYGRHRCPGSAIAQLQAAVVLDVMDELSVYSPTLGEVEWRVGLVGQGPTRVPVAFRPR
jgi:cytochrome P450